MTAAACATNPATGERQLALISEAQEIQMGRAAAADVQQTIGFVDDPGLQQYVQRIGGREAHASERPNLPWEFHVVDDPAQNAFALPGGFIYVTRGMMNLMTSEAQLAGVLGHEIGHVTARHTVNQISKQQLAQLGLGLGGVLFPQVQQFGGALGAGLNLLFLKYSRDDERQADTLGFDYMRKQGYAVSEFDDVFRSLERIEQNEHASALPEWLTTHPSSEERVKAAEERASKVPANPNARIGRDDYLREIDHLVYGENPRQGFFQNGVFYHPDLKFQVQFPNGWKTQNLTQAVVGVAGDNRAAFELTLAGDIAPQQALGRFFSQNGIRGGRTALDTVHGQPAAIGEFQAATDQGVVQGLAGYVAHGGRTYQLIGYAPASVYPQYSGVLQQIIGSFSPLTDSRILSVQPRRIDIVRIDQPETVEQFARRIDSPVAPQMLAILNQVPNETSRLSSGTLVKGVVGQPNPGQ